MTILGQHSVAEVKELIAAKDYEQKQIEAAYAQLLTRGDNQELQTWRGEWDALKKRYDWARTLANAKIAAAELNPLIRTSIVPAEGDWQSILHALTKVPGSYTRGDVQDLYNRITAMGAHVDESNVPQPTSGTDADLQAFKTLDNATKQIEKTATSTPVFVVGGLVTAVAAAWLYHEFSR